MNPENRTLLLVTVDDAAEADRTFDMLMGDAVDPRRRFIQTHAIRRFRESGLVLYPTAPLKSHPILSLS